MRTLVRSNAFKKDYKRIMKRHYPQGDLVSVLRLLMADTPLPPNHRPHKLGGEYAGLWECHIAPDWLLIYEYHQKELILRRTGTHADLFK